jgi:rhamnopyranosyl-N-acetylglucosaminyl-diphospho-decaprenol beta-1,3/1,4-galactofuranosyltransferase
VHVTCLVHNGAATILEVLDAVAAQGAAVQRVVVVDNASTDGSPALLESWRSADPERRRLVLHDSNVGVGAGHAAAWSVALADGADRVWCLEHDSVPLDGCLEQLLAAGDRLAGTRYAGAVLGPRLYRDRHELAAGIGDPDRSELRRGRELAGAASPILDGAGVVPVDRLTFNGLLVPRAVIDAVGTPREDLFVGAEDWEWSRRAVALRVPLCSVAAARMLHATKGDRRHGERQSPSRTYYSVRNLLLIEPAGGPGRARAWADCAAGAARSLVVGPYRRRSIVARVVGTRDGLAGTSGQRTYGFMQERTGARPGGW